VRLLGYVDCLSRVPGDWYARFCGEGVIAISSPYPTTYALNETYAAYVGCWTDVSPLTRQQVTAILRSQQGVVLATGEVDLYQVVFGATRTTQRSTVAVGGGCPMGQEAPHPMSILPPRATSWA
jgi:hypothetical protein